MIDLHCHLLPEVDDGPADLPAALALARLAVDNGITHAVTTPHVHPGRYENSRSSLEAVYHQFTTALESENIPLKLAVAGEVRVCPEIPLMMSAEEIPFLGEWQGRPVVLLELPHSHVPPGSDRLVEWLMARDIQPMIAHPERNKDVMRKYSKIEPFVEAGCLFQVTAMSMAGQFGEGAHRRALELLDAGVVTILASDAHNLNHRPPTLEPGRLAAAARVGEVESWELVLGRPRQIAESKFSGVSAAAQAGQPLA